MKRIKPTALLMCLILLFSSCASSGMSSENAISSMQQETFGDAAGVSARPQNQVQQKTELPMDPIETDKSSFEKSTENADASDTSEISDSSDILEPAEDTAMESAGDSSSESTSDTDAEEKLSRMSLEEKVAQLFMITPEALTGVDTVTMAGDTTREAFENVPVGGLIYFDQNLVDESQVTEMLDEMQTISQERIGLPIFTGIDEEGGTVARIGGSGRFDVPEIGDMCDIGAAGDVNTAYDAGVTIGTYLSRMGFNLDFAPDADVLSNPDNTIVKYRSFGSEPELVSQMALAVGDGLNSCGVIACCKHFPGHGATEGDTHAGYAFTNKTLEELESCELIPFNDWAADQAGMIMVGHISLPNVIGDDTPASLSSEIITGLLRDQMGFDGVIITDALNMGAITQQYTSAEAAVAALQAGADMLMMPENFQEAYQGVLEAVNNGTISEERIDESVMRILRLKLSLNNC